MRPADDLMIERLLEGKTYREMAAEFGCSISRLHYWLNEPQIAEQSARARLSSAEAWLDRGLAVIESALDKQGNVDASAARAYAQECARRAAIRNPSYRESSKTELTGPNGGPIRVATAADMTDDALAAIAAGKQ
jgi:hypothetical protein